MVNKTEMIDIGLMNIVRKPVLTILLIMPEKQQYSILLKTAGVFLPLDGQEV